MARQFNKGLLCAATALCGAWGAPALAQETETSTATSGGAGLNEIVVTAQRREENLQEVPITITAFDEEALETRRIDGFEQIATYTPALFAAPSSADSNGIRFTLRGIGSNDPQIGVDSKTALYVDGQYMGKTTGLAFDSPDLARVEVLKGPQGTLYGRNAVAGAINLISARPEGGRTFGKVNVDYGNYNALRIGAAVNLPAGENGGIRISGLYNRRDGWVENTGLGDDFGGYERYGVRAAIGGDVTPTLRLDAALDYSRSRNQTPFYHPLAGTASPTALFAAAVTPVTGRVDQAATSFENETSSSNNYGFSFTADWEFDPNHSVRLLTGWRGADAKRFTTLFPTFNAAIGNAIYRADLDRNPDNGILGLRDAFLLVPTVVGLVGRTTRPDYLAAVAGFTPGSAYQSVPGGANTLSDHQQFTVDLTFTGEFGPRIDYTFGAYYFREETGSGRGRSRRDDISGILPLLGSLGNIFGALGPLGQLQNPNLTPAQRQALLQQAQGSAAGLVTTLDGLRYSTTNSLSIDTNAYALYGQITWGLTDRFRVVTGLRYSIDDKYAYQQSTSPIFQDNISLLGTPILPNIADKTFKSFDPSIILQYDIAEDTMLYASRVESFRSGGFNQISQNARIPGETYASDFIFGNEEITAYEAGLKSELLDRRLRLNLAGFYYQLDNEQSSLSQGGAESVARIIVNADTRIWGAEVEAAFALSDALTASAAYAWTDGDPDDLINPVTGQVVLRDELLGAPKHSFSASLDFNQDVEATNVGLFGHVGYNYKSRALITAIPVAYSTSQNLVDARLGVAFPLGGGEGKLSVWAQNLLDDEYIADRIGLGALAYDIAQYGTPRTYGVSFGVEF